jgi:hypothetical protein
MAVARGIKIVKRLVDQVAPGVTLLWRRHRLARDLARRRRPLPTEPQAKQQPVVLFFAPEAMLTPHFATHLIVARTLHELGHRVLVVRCVGDLLPRCVALEAAALSVDATSADRARLCEGCVGQSLAMVDAYGLDSIDLSQIIEPAMRQELRSAMANLPENLSEFTFAGVPIGQFATADMARILKVNNPSAAGHAIRERVRQYIETALLSYLAVRSMCNRFNVLRLVYFNDYAMTLAAAAAAGRGEIPTTHLSHVPVLNNDRRQIVMLTGYGPLEGLRRLREWPQWRDLALPPERIAMISEDSFLRFAGSGFTIYSPAWSAASENLFERLQLDRKRRLLVAYTSSEDEVRAVRFYEDAFGVTIYPGTSPFVDQFDWLQSLVDHVAASDDLQLVIRVHPREAPNHRESRISENLQELRRRFSGSYRNVRVVWPSDPVSSYDLAEIADVALISLSSIGLELARLGIPVVTAFPHMTEVPPGVFLDWNRTRADYFVTVRQAFDAPLSLERVAAAFRWVNARSIEYAVDFSDVVPTPNCPGLPPFKLPREARTVEEVLIGGRCLPDLNHERLERAQHLDSTAHEREAIGVHLRAFLHLLLLGTRPERDYRFTISSTTLALAGDEDRSCAVVIRGPAVTFAASERQVTKFSPMAARLALLAASLNIAAEAAAEF